MGKIRWYKRDPDAALSGMFELSLEERGAYNTVLDLIYARANNLPDDDRFIAGWLRCDIRVWRRIKSSLIGAGKLRAEGRLICSPDFDPALITDARASIPLAIRVLVEAKAGGRCLYCESAEGPFEIDHVYPVALGGSDDLDNLAFACRPCNRSKGCKPLNEWLQ